MYFIVGIVIILCTVGLILYIHITDTFIVKVDKNQITDFKYSMKVSGLPVLIMQQNGKDYNFLYDTGSNACYINSTVDIELEDNNAKSSFIGADGKSIETSLKTVVLELDKKKYAHQFHVTDLTASFTDVKNSYGVNLDGIIGTDFMSAYNYCIDFKEYVIYCRK